MMVLSLLEKIIGLGNMQHPKHVQWHHAIGLSRLKYCIAQCKLPKTDKGTIYSLRFNNSFDTLLKSIV